MRKIKSGFVAIAALLSAEQGAIAATANVPFTGVVTATCVLTVGTPGVMSASTDFTSLSSTNAGGVAGTVSALSTGTAFKVSAIAPTSFTASPANGGNAVTFNSLYRGTGATSIGSTPGNTTTTLGAGLTNLTVDLAAVKSAGTFDAGAYAAEVIVRCE
jgi:hypothetical protein